MELKRDEIIKALECCYMQELEHNENCPECPYTDLYPNCTEYLGKDALALINSQEQRMEALTVELAAMRGAANSCKLHNEKLTEENERLKSVEFTCGFVKPHKVLECPIFDEIARTKADTVREMQELIKAEKFHHKNFGDLVYLADIDRIAKEMLEDNNDSGN